MKSVFNEDTICALSTPPLMAALAVIRMSGKDSIDVIGRCFDRDLSELSGNTVVHGKIIDGEKILDDVVISLFRAPRSFTGENVVEISCHGSMYVANSIIKTLIKNGARQAERGEFSKRAFLNGKIDTVKAESIIDIIEAESGKEVDIAISHLGGRLSAEIEAIREDLLGVSAQIMASIDYPDDEIEELLPENLYNTLRKNYDRIRKLSASFENGKLIKNGISVAIVGKPNAGKSSVMNCLSGFDRSIVTDVKGTTRDTIEETVSLGGYKIRLIDTAGIRETEDAVEKIGVERALDSIKKADIILAVFDSGDEFSEEDREIISVVREINVPKIAAINKTDIGHGFDLEDGIFDKKIFISAVTGDGIDKLTDAIISVAEGGKALNNGEIIMNERQFNCLAAAEKALEQCMGDIKLPPDVLEICIEDAIEALAQTVGKSVNEDLLGAIFSRFCVGK